MDDLSRCDFVMLQKALELADIVESSLTSHHKTRPLRPSQKRRFREVQLPDGTLELLLSKNRQGECVNKVTTTTTTMMRFGETVADCLLYRELLCIPATERRAQKLLIGSVLPVFHGGDAQQHGARAVLSDHQRAMLRHSPHTGTTW